VPRSFRFVVCSYYLIFITIVSKCRLCLNLIAVVKDEAITSKDIGIASLLVLSKRNINLIGRKSLILDISEKKSSIEYYQIIVI
jgi:hypothetical protein